MKLEMQILSNYLNNAFVVNRKAGYVSCRSGCCTQPKSVIVALRYLMVPGPILLIIISLVFLWEHPINEKERKEIIEMLKNIR